MQKQFTFETSDWQESTKADEIARAMLRERDELDNNYVLESLGGTTGGRAVWRVTYDEAILIENTQVAPDTLVVYAEAPGGDSLYGTWGYKYSTVDKAVEILMRDFNVDEEIARNCVEVMTAKEASERGIAYFCRIARAQE